MKKLLTISIAAYNVQNYLEQCLTSLLIPNMDKLEVLIENDGSKDNTAQIAKTFEEKYPSVFRLIDKENGGYGSTINNSIRLATGKYFKQLDGDDWYDTTHLEQLINQLETIDADCVFTPFMEVYEDDGQETLRGKTELSNGIHLLDDVVNQAWFLQMHGLAFRTQLLKDHNVTILEHCFYTDQEYVIYPLLHVNTVFVFDRHIYCYRLGRDGQSVSLEGWRKHYAEHEQVIRQLLTKYDQLSVCSQPVRYQLTRRLVDLIKWQYSLYMMLGDKQSQLKCFDRYLKNNHKEMFSTFQHKEGKRVKLLRASGFLLYPLLRKKTGD